MPVLIGLVLVACSGSAPTVSPTPLPTTAPVANAAQAGAAAFALTTSARATEASSRATEVTGHAFETATAVGATRVVASTATADAYAASVANRYATATAVIAAQQVGLTATAQVISAARTATAMPTPTPVLPPGMSLVNGQPEDVADFLPSNPGLIRLLMMRDAPELITDDVLIAFNTFQVRAEQAAWHELDETMQRERETENQPRDPGCTNPVGCLKWNLKPFTFEWQKRIEQQPDLAQGALMDAFIRPDADWSFVTKEPGWDDTRSNAVALFVFSRESVEGRDPQFAARELVPVMRRFVSAAVKRTPTRFWMNLPLPRAVWDFQTSSFQFYDPNATIGGKFLDKVDVLAARTNPNELADFPEAVRPLANYNLGAQSTSDPRLSAHVGSGLLGAPTAVVASSPAWVNIVWATGWSATPATSCRWIEPFKSRH